VWQARWCALRLFRDNTQRFVNHFRNSVEQRIFVAIQLFAGFRYHPDGVWMKIERTQPGRTNAAKPVRAPDQASAPPPSGDVATIAGLSETDLTPKVRQALDLLMTEVQRMREELSQARHRINYLEKLADEDTLVPVANRRAFVREMSRMVAYAERYGAGSSVLYFDINGFKEINDQHGHAAGDAALRQIAELLAENVRESDIVGRLGGDEFGVILAQASPEVAAEKAASLSALIATTPLDWEGTAITLSVSYGVYSFSGTEDAGEALQRADQAMYEQKQGRAVGD
jgi:diguanylate cyclase (GGDEF)-like protein